MIMMETYEDIDLDEDPCIFLRCGHFLTRSSMDGNMGMNDHYDLDENGAALAIRSRSQPFDTVLKTFTTCRGSLRDIARYGRVVRRALLDESTKRLITWATEQLKMLQRVVFDAEESTTLTRPQRPIPVPLILQGPRDHQFKTMLSLPHWRRENKKVSDAFLDLVSFTSDIYDNPLHSSPKS